MQRAKIDRLWWLHPGWLFVLAVGSTLLLAYTQTEQGYRLYGTPKYFDGNDLALGLLGVLVFCLGCWLGKRTGGAPQPLPTDNPGILRPIEFCFYLSAGLTIFGYLVWLAVGVKNGFSPGMIPGMILSPDEHLTDALRRDYFQTIPGVTTCTQFGLAAMPLGAWLFFQPELKRRRLIGTLLGALLLAALVRAFLLGERMALIELAVPAGLITLQQAVIGKSWPRWIVYATRALPAIAVAALISLFAASESIRSWSHYQDEFDSIIDFTVWRIGGYYTTAHNNGAMSYRLEGQREIPYATFQAFWTFPGVPDSSLGYSHLTGQDPTTHHETVLETHANAEYNSPGGLFQPLLDFGPAGYLIFWTLCGFVASRAYRSFQANSIVGICFYPMLVVAILDVPRILYLCNQRAFPAIVALAGTVWLVHRQRAAPVARKDNLPSGK